MLNKNKCCLQSNNYYRADVTVILRRASLNICLAFLFADVAADYMCYFCTKGSGIPHERNTPSLKITCHFVTPAL